MAGQLAGVAQIAANVAGETKVAAPAVLNVLLNFRFGVVDGEGHIHPGITLRCYTVIHGCGIAAAIELVKGVEAADDPLRALGPLAFVSADLVAELQSLVAGQLANEFGEAKLLLGIGARDFIPTAIVKPLMITLTDGYHGTPLVVQSPKQGGAGFIAVGVGEGAQFDQCTDLFTGPQQIFRVLGNKPYGTTKRASA